MPDQGLQPLLFIVKDPKNYTQGSKDAKAVASHVSARYRGWRKANRRSLTLDSTTKAILTSKSSSHRVPEPAVQSVVKVEMEKSDYVRNVARLHEHHDQMIKRSDHFSANFSKKTFQFQKESDENWTIFADLVSPELINLGSHFFDPFTPTNVKFDSEMRANLHFYFKVVKPFATHLMKPWSWFDSLARIQNAPVLAYAVAAFASIFLSGCLKGGPGVVLPPAEEQGRRSLWPIPPWLRLQTRCFMELNAILPNASPETVETCYEAILFLFRISVLLADGEPARMHFKALQRIAIVLGKKDVPFKTELALTKVNIICAFLHNQSVVLVRTRGQDSTKSVKEVIEIDRKLWTSDREWYNHRASLCGRLLAWRKEEPGEKLQKDTAAAVLRLDPSSRFLKDTERIEMHRCYQIAIYFVTYLHGINFNTSSPRIKSSVIILRDKLSKMNLYFMRTVCKCTLFNIILAGAMASRGHWERGWFIKLLTTHYPEVQYMDDLYAMLVEFIDPFGIVFSILEEIWEDVLKFRSALSFHTGQMDLYRGNVIRPVEQNRPITYSPDLTKPTDIVESREIGVDIGEEFS